MKKILLGLFLASATLVTTTSCTKEYITNQNFLPGVSYVKEIRSNDWVKEAEGLYSIDLRISDLDAEYFEYGNVQVALEFASNPNTYDIIPATIKNVHYSVNYTIGSVMIFAEDRNPNPKRPEKMVAKVTLTDAD
ncbi:hypothetical protein ORI89_11705 [Sphingobacterium sp. UT-1RO-CII-1]|uniref:hypothetical protein n=1 Tax=Sphingobacterium sp. UT-1RO-CII-1 TaxID=2995225 RepID=UPI00227A774E|nr:hypothetical protein [Sphingobacterium sp. UT-1RO-CII-1]MCY4780318.1 hypothetical protein [Sphingobacterium sp. UT-1RO-CII-1]